MEQEGGGSRQYWVQVVYNTKAIPEGGEVTMYYARYFIAKDVAVNFRKPHKNCALEDCPCGCAKVHVRLFEEKSRVLKPQAGAASNPSGAARVFVGAGSGAAREVAGAARQVVKPISEEQSFWGC